MTRRHWLLVGIGITLAVWTPSAEEDTAARITGATLSRGGALAFLETLTDTIGGRVTGSPQNRAASELILAALKEAGSRSPRRSVTPAHPRSGSTCVTPSTPIQIHGDSTG